MFEYEIDKNIEQDNNTWYSIPDVLYKTIECQNSGKQNERNICT